MRIFHHIFLLSALLASFCVHATDLNASYLPSRAEWLKQTLVSSLYEQSNMWGKRLAVIVVINAEENTAIVSVTLANGETEPSSVERERYVQSVQSIARAVLARYSWAKDVKLIVQFV
jgi:hypothetical protein